MCVFCKGFVLQVWTTETYKKLVKLSPFEKFRQKIVWREHFLGSFSVYRQ